MKFKRPKRAPAILAFLTLVFVCGLRLWNPDTIDRLERQSYDLRVRYAAQFPSPAATNLAFVAMEDSSIAAVRSGTLGYRYGLYWPRQVYGRLVEELAAQGAKAVAFDVLFGELRPDHPQVQLADGSLMDSDEFFAHQLRHSGHSLIAATPDTAPPRLFATNALALGDISAVKDSDGILRRVRAFCTVRRWHPLIENAAQKNGVDIGSLILESNRVVLPLVSGEFLEIPLDAHGEMELKNNKSPNPPATAKPFTDERVWHMGILLASQELKLDLANATVDLTRGKIILRGAAGVERIIPVDAAGDFLIDWRLTAADPLLARQPIESLLWQDKLRLLGETNDLRNEFRGKLVVIGSAAQGNDLTDRGATPLENDTLLVSKHWNVANTILTGNFIRRASLPMELALVLLLGGLTALLTWQTRAITAFGGVLLLALTYCVAAGAAYVKFRFWLPVVIPVGGAMLVQYVVLAVHRAMFEEDDKRRIRSIFSKLVSPNVVNELLNAEELSLGGARREVTVMFADVRGFTALTDQMQEQVAEFTQANRTDPARAKVHFEESARETLEMVNLYLAAVADAVKKHGGTLDKYIGDCVMAFWNAPTPVENHASAAVRAAVDAQRAIQELNEKRLALNPAREAENQARIAAGMPPRPLHVALHVGTGINTGLATVGLMGSDQHILNYTVFGREVNLASRLEGVSGSGRIIISATTHACLRQQAPEIAADCKELPPVTLKGFRDAVIAHEVPWRVAAANQ